MCCVAVSAYHLKPWQKSIHIIKMHWKITYNEENAVLAPFSYLYINSEDMKLVICELWCAATESLINDS